MRFPVIRLSLVLVLFDTFLFPLPNSPDLGRSQLAMGLDVAQCIDT